MIHSLYLIVLYCSNLHWKDILSGCPGLTFFLKLFFLYLLDLLIIFLSLILIRFFYIFIFGCTNYANREKLQISYKTRSGHKGDENKRHWRHTKMCKINLTSSCKKFHTFFFFFLFSLYFFACCYWKRKYHSLFK